jgi:hypothetical protein
MTRRDCFCVWQLFAAVLAAAVATYLLDARALLAAEPEPEAALKQAQAEEKAAEAEWNSREMARSATREIARSERQRAEHVLRQLLAAKTALARAADAPAAATDRAAAQVVEEQLVAARKQSGQRMDTMRAAAERLIAESRTADKAAQELLVAEDALRRTMDATRKAELAVLEQTFPEAEKKSAENASTARQAVRDAHVVAAWEPQLWAGVQRSTGQQIVEQTRHAAEIASRIAEVESDEARKQALLQFAKEERQLCKTAGELIAEKNGAIDRSVADIYPRRAAAMNGLEPLSPSDWNYAAARHLMVRAGFGGTPQEVEQLCSLGLYKAVDHLVEFYRHPAADAPFDARPRLPADPLEARLRNDFIRNQAAETRNGAEGDQAGRLRRWWLERLVASPRPLQEKLTLFWHGLFAAQNSVVQNSYAMYQQNRLLREHAAGNFGALLYGIVHDPAMIKYLDNDRNLKGQPNENLAREIMELFSMGVDQGYTEQDIVQAARALTGYTLDQPTSGFRYLHDRHDSGDKTIFGKTGPWTGDDLVRLILEQPATSRFIARRLWQHFGSIEPPAETVEQLAAVLRASNYEIEPALKNLFLSKEFYSAAVMGQQIKAPIELVVGTLRDLGVRQVKDYGRLDAMVRDMGQELFEPPDVKGWRHGRPWISSSRLFVRYNSVAEVVRSLAQGDRHGVDVVGVIQRSGCKRAEDVVDYLAKACLVGTLDSEKRKELVGFLGDLPAVEDWSARRAELNEKVQEVLILILSQPEAQMG